MGEEASNTSYSQAINLYDNRVSRSPLTVAIIPIVAFGLCVLFRGVAGRHQVRKLTTMGRQDSRGIGYFQG